jgi:hypothetical protein
VRLIFFIRPKSLALFAVKLYDLGKQEHHEFVGWPHLVFPETDGAFVGLLLSLGKLL